MYCKFHPPDSCELDNVSPLEWCLTRPPSPGNTDSRCTRIITFKAEIRTGQNCGAQILLTNDGLVAKIYDPIYYHGFDGFYKKSIDPTATADHDYRNEANAYSAMMSSKVQGDIMPRYHGSWTFEITATIEGQQRSRDVRMILMDHISGIPMLDIEPEDLSCKARKNILYKVIEAETDLRIAGLEHHDLEPRNIMIIPSSVYGSSSDDELSGVPNYETSTFDNADLRVCIIDFARSCVYKLVGKQRIAAEYHNPLYTWAGKDPWHEDGWSSRGETIDWMWDMWGDGGMAGKYVRAERDLEDYYGRPV